MGQIKNIKLHIVTDIKGICMMKDLKLMFTFVCAQAILSSFLVFGTPTPQRYGKYNTIPYEVLNKTDDFEIRRYPSFRYAEAREPNVGMSTANSRNFRKLF